jgi:hypothetical protein
MSVTAVAERQRVLRHMNVTAFLLGIEPQQQQQTNGNRNT